MEGTKIHEPVLVDEVLKYLNVEKLAHLKSQAKVIDATVGAGGHSYQLVRRGIFVLGIDDDPEMLEVAREKLISACPDENRPVLIPTSNSVGSSYHLVNSNFRNLDKISEKLGIIKVDGILFDLGTSYYQLTSKSRGFSFDNKNTALDMRLNKERQNVTAADLLNSLPKSKLQDVFSQTCEFRIAKLLARDVSIKRKRKKIKIVGDLTEILEEPVYKKLTKGLRIHMATLPFLALRIVVNSELENLKEVLPKAFRILKRGGRLVVISFHSKEDKLVKDFFKEKSKLGLAQELTKKPIVSSEIERQKNPSARSAKLRALEKI